jgi:hypothetical protein
MDGGSAVDFLPADTLQEASVSSWTPAGQLLFCRFTRPATDCELVVTSPGGGTELVLAGSVSGLVSAEYSRDATLIALTAYGPGFVFDIYTIPASGGFLTNLTNTPASHELTPSWVP